MNISIENNKNQMYQSTQVNQKQAVAMVESTAADAEVQKSVSISSQTDRIEISAEGRAALAQSAVVSTSEAQGVQAEQAQVTQAVQVAQAAQAAQAAQGVPIQQTTEARLQAVKQEAAGQKAAVGMAPGGAQVEETEAAEESSALAAEVEDAETSTDEAVIASASDSSSTNLTTLSEQQISSLVSEGAISQAEAQAELARRAAAAQQAQEMNESPASSTESVRAAQEKTVETAKEVQSAYDPQQQAANMYTQMQQNEGAALFSAVA